MPLLPLLELDDEPCPHASSRESDECHESAEDELLLLPDFELPPLFPDLPEDPPLLPLLPLELEFRVHLLLG